MRESLPSTFVDGPRAARSSAPPFTTIIAAVACWLAVALVKRGRPKAGVTLGLASVHGTVVR